MTKNILITFFTIILFCLFTLWLQLVMVIEDPSNKDESLDQPSSSSSSSSYLLTIINKSSQKINGLIKTLETNDNSDEKMLRLKQELQSIKIDFNQGMGDKSSHLGYKAINANPDRLCTENPYLSSLNNTLQQISDKASNWLQNQHNIELDLVARSKNGINHIRFDAFQEMTSCNYTCVGGTCRDDESKIVCGLEKLQPNCIVYSIGSNNLWAFEEDILKNTPCHVYSFDCTGDKSRFQPPQHERMHFYHICLGSKYIPAPAKDNQSTSSFWVSQVQGETMTLYQIQKMLHHSKIDLLKFDVEGYEWPIFDSWPELEDSMSLEVALPFQVLVEIHTISYMKDISLAGRASFKYETDVMRLASHLLKAGYVTVLRDNNAACSFCTELTLLRYKCPQH